MSNRPMKRIRDSYTEQVHLIMPEHINGYGRLFGGKLVEWIDVVAGVVARRHSNRNATTVCIDHLSFLAPAHADDTIFMRGKITWVGNTSMEVCVESYIESLSGFRTLINKAYLVFAALDQNERPTQVPGVILETATEQQEWAAGEKRNQIRKTRMQESF